MPDLNRMMPSGTSNSSYVTPEGFVPRYCYINQNALNEFQSGGYI